MGSGEIQHSGGKAAELKGTLDGHPALFAYPARTALGRMVPKSRVYVAGSPGRRVRDRITDKVAQIVWRNKLAPETLKLPASRAVPEIQVFSIALKPSIMAENLPEDILRCIDRAIGFPIIFELTTHPEDDADSGRIRVAASYKRPSEAETGKWVVGDYYATGWLPADAPRTPLPVALNMGALYEQILRRLIQTPIRQGESVAALVERQGRIAAKQRERRRLEARMQREKQFNRKIEINRQIRKLKTDLNSLRQ